MRHASCVSFNSEEWKDEADMRVEEMEAEAEITGKIRECRHNKSRSCRCRGNETCPYYHQQETR